MLTRMRIHANLNKNSVSLANVDPPGLPPVVSSGYNKRTVRKFVKYSQNTFCQLFNTSVR